MSLFPLKMNKAAGAVPRDLLCGFIKFYNSFLWAMTASMLMALWLWLGMRANMGLVFYGLWLGLTLLLCLACRRWKPGWKFTAVNLALCAALNLLVFGADKLKSLPAARIREGIGQTQWPLGTVTALWLGFLALGLAGIVFLGIRQDRKAKE